MAIYRFLLAPLLELPGIGTSTADRLAARGIRTIGDLLLVRPKGWEDDVPQPIASLIPGRPARVVARIVERRVRGLGKRTMLQLRLRDESGEAWATFFHAQHLARDARLKEGMEIALRGVPERFAGRWQFAHPEWTPKARFRAGVRARYPAIAGISPRRWQAWIEAALARLPRSPAPWDDALGMPLYAAFLGLHDPDAAPAALERLCREEWHVHQHLLLARKKKAAARGVRIVPGEKTNALIEQLPWPLTEAQHQVWQEIAEDLASGRRMHRLVQGDVGAGKTVVAALAACACVEAGWQAALMAPTEVLARQHHATLQQLLAHLGIDVRLLTGSTRASARREILSMLASGAPCVVVGTHALIVDEVQIPRLALAIVDEQHRFGVRQRWLLAEKGAQPAHLLSMTATPIPRTLALALYGDLDLSVMRGLPPGRKPVITRVVRRSQRLREALARMLAEGGRIYWIVPRIDDEDEANVLARAEQLARHFPDAGVRALHGRMRAAEKEDALSAFAEGSCRLLVATTVVEVGVNVPEARVIVIEDADRYGLAQLHQLRGRVGRASEQGYCLLLPSSAAKEEQLERLRLLEQCHDGFRLAEEDMKRRGAGDPIGLRQSGDAGFRLLDPVLDGERIQRWAEVLPEPAPTEAMIRFWKPEAEAISAD